MARGIKSAGGTPELTNKMAFRKARKPRVAGVRRNARPMSGGSGGNPSPLGGRPKRNVSPKAPADIGRTPKARKLKSKGGTKRVDKEMPYSSSVHTGAGRGGRKVFSDKTHARQVPANSPGKLGHSKPSDTSIQKSRRGRPVGAKTIIKSRWLRSSKGY